MASNTKQTKFRRKLRRAKAGKDRKRAEQNQGTTPPFAIHTEASHAQAPKEQLPRKEE